MTKEKYTTKQTDVKILATIELDGDLGRGQLYYADADIWCILPDGTRQATQTGCTEDQAVKTIMDSWGNGTWPWNLQWVEDN